MRRIKKMLVAEDNAADLELIRNAFKSVNPNIEIVVVKDGLELMEYFKTESVDSLGLLLLDMNIPHMNGLEILKEFYVDELLKNIPVIIFTSSEDSDKIISCYEYGANACIRKPQDLNEFNRVIKAIADFWLEINVLPNLKMPVM